MSDGNIIDARQIFAEQAQAVEREIEIMETAHQMAQPEVEWFRKQIQGRIFLSSIGLDLSQVPLMKPPDNLISDDPEIEALRQVAYRIFKHMEE